MPNELLQKKVINILKQSEALQYYWQRPVTVEQLQSEMERMAKHTKKPKVLAALWNTLHNDPQLIAECLALPILVNRLIKNFYAFDTRFHGSLKAKIESELKKYPHSLNNKSMTGIYSEYEIAKESSPGKRDSHTVILNKNEWHDYINRFAQKDKNKWSDVKEDEVSFYSEALLSMDSERIKIARISWQKTLFDTWWPMVQSRFTDTMNIPEHSYQLPPIVASPCTDDTWSVMAGPAEARSDHTAIWTGNEMIVWGGAGPRFSGGRYNPATDTWTLISTVNVPPAKYLHTAIWTGTEMIVWGGEYYDTTTHFLNTGARYNPGTDAWTATLTVNVPVERNRYTAVWTGTEMIIWAGSGGTNAGKTGGRYNPVSDSWVAVSTTNCPSERSYHAAVWTGTLMVVWGGSLSSPYLATGGRYNPATDSWTTISTINAPAARSGPAAVWTSSEMIIWSGYNGSAMNTGGRYNPISDSWTPTSMTGVPGARDYAVAVWTGAEMIIWAGYGTSSFLNDGARYNPSSDSWTSMSSIHPLSGGALMAFVWTGAEMMAWGAMYWGGNLDTGGLYCAFVPGPGTIPDNNNYPGIPLFLNKSGNDVILNWSAPGQPCQTQDYAVYRGILPWTGHNHASIACSTGGMTTYTINETTERAYYLVVALLNGKEGSYGIDSANIQRPDASASCFPQLIGTCN